MDKRSLIFVFGLAIILFFVNQLFFPKNATPAPTTQTEQVALPAPQTPVTPSPSASAIEFNQEEFFVLENDYQQIVFSNLGGAIAEINLPLKSKKNSRSSVLPIRFDRLFASDYSFDDYYPTFPYYINQGNGVKKMEQRTLGSYYPLLRRTLVNKNGVPLKSPTAFYALKIDSENKSLEGKLFSLKRLEKDLIEFEYSDKERTITKLFRFPKHVKGVPYLIESVISVNGDSRGLWLTGGIPEVEIISDNAAPAMTYEFTKSNQKPGVKSISLPKECTITSDIAPNWVCSANGFFGLILNKITPSNSGYKACKVPGTDDPTRLTLIDPEYHPFNPEKYPGYEFQLPLSSQVTELRYYAGPLEEKVLKHIDAVYANPETGYHPYFIGALSFHGWFSFISEPFAKFLFILMKLFHAITRSWGISIILLTVVLRIMLYPLNAWSIRSTMKMQEVAPKVSAIQQKYKKEPKRAQLEVMQLYKEKGVNPLSGCFPMLIQLPFLMGMFDLLKTTFQLRGASFIPGWIDNLSAPDVLFSWNYPIIFFGNDFHLLPFLLGGVMWAQQRFSASAPKDKALMTDQQKQQRMMGNVMTIVFTVMFYHFPSGLNLYWLSSMALGILQQWMMTRKMMLKKLA